MYAVCVTFKLNDGQAAAFMPLMQENAQTSLVNESGCCAGGHSRGLQAVRVRTAVGWMVLASGAAHYYE